MMPPPPEASTPAGSASLLAGVVARVTFQNPENGYAVIKLDAESPVPPGLRQVDGLVAAVGVMPGISEGAAIVAQGEWVRDAKFGPQFKIEWYKPSLPSGLRGIKTYLASGAVRGVGPVLAERIVKVFGTDTFAVLDHRIERLAEVPGIGIKTRRKIVQAWGEARGDRELVSFLGEHGVSPAIAARLRKVYGERALSVVRANPYRLTADVRGIGFRRADDIARKIGLAEDAPERIDAALAHVLERQAEEGHTYQPRPRLEELAVELLKVERDRIADRIDAALLGKTMVVREMAGEPGIFLPLLHDAEQRAAWRLRQLVAAPRRPPPGDAVATLADFEQRARIELAPAQRQAVLTFAREGMMVLTGGPGTGKTTTVRAILELYHLARRTIKLAAPTGRAARRLAETSHMQAETLHRMLGFQAHLGEFTRNGSNPIEADLVVVDEVSMLDAPLAASLFEAVASGAGLLLVGDEDQLPSVGPGNVLGDIIAAGVLPMVRLTEVFRQAGESLIVTNAHRINRGMMPLLEPPEGQAAPDFFFIERDDPRGVIETIKVLAAERIPGRFQIDPRRDLQVLTPMRRGELGVESLNLELKALLNPGGTGGEGLAPGLFEDEDAAGGPAITVRRQLFSAGDRVMQISNNYDKNVFNGDIGFIEHVDAQAREVIVQFEGRPVSYLADDLDQLVLAYATTIHKSQGSEYPVVILPIHTQHWIMLQRNLIYTALTRARRLVCMVGSKRALRRAVSNAQRARRYTALRAFLEEPHA